MESQTAERIQNQLNAAISALQELQSETLHHEPMSELSSQQLPLDSVITTLSEKLNSSLKQAEGELTQNIDSNLRDLSEDLKNFCVNFKNDLKQETKHSFNKNSRFFSQKVHRHGKPLLLTMLANEDLRTIYHIFIAIMLVMITGDCMKDYLENGRIIEISLVLWAFGGIPYVIPFWCLMYLWSLTPILLIQGINKYKYTRSTWLPIYIFIQIVQYVVPCWFCLYMGFPVASSLIIQIEMCRISMKIHSYFREKMLFSMGLGEYSTFIPENLKKRGVTIEDLNLPEMNVMDIWTEINRFTYFFFAPTLIYRDSYPRLGVKRRWDMILINFSNFAGAILYTYMILKSFSIPYFKETWSTPFDTRFFLLSTFKSMLPGTTLLLLLFFGFLHSWQNLWAEIMRFADRNFYEDWWNVSSFATYYRKWNIVVHEWLFYYVYQDFVRFSKGKIGPSGSYMWVFLISDIFHELIIACSFGFFYPILLFMFGGPGVLYTFMPRQENRGLNIFVWSMFLIGNGLLIILYSWEYFARQGLDLSPEYGGWAYFIPHSWFIKRD
jgi:sterol O-acyltransferase